MRQVPPPSCLEAEFERQAIDDGMNVSPVFPENIEYRKNIRMKSLEETYEAIDKGITD